ncbi:MAG TPA: dihydrodipicolinate synthase family protein [Puia sp.]|nr:dihydrodipicolinate synthase family protein [Puia sp.]
MLTAKNLRGNWGTLLLPVNKNDSIDYIRLGEEIELLIGAGLDGMYSNGTAGEFHNQSETEFDRVQVIMAEKCQALNMPFQIGASHPVPLITLERIKRTVSLKPDAFQVILPDWVVTGEEEQICFLERIGEAAGNIPLVLYNPPHAKSVLSPADLSRISRVIPRIIGIKTGAGDATWYKEMRSLSPDLSVFVPGHLLATGVQEKVAAGAYSNVACLSPQGSQKWWRLMDPLRPNERPSPGQLPGDPAGNPSPKGLAPDQPSADLSAALEIQGRILEFFDRCIVPYKKAGYSNPALDKFLAAIGGWADIGTRLRWPYKYIDEKDVAPARTIARQLLGEFF